MPSKSISLTRRDFLKLTGGFAAFGFAIFAFRPQPTFPSILPPGAILPAEQFRAQCQRCGKCVAICARRALAQDASGVPYINGLSGWCDLCLDCVRVCPTGALRAVDPKQFKLGLAEIDRDQCLAWRGNGCRLCYEKCESLQKAIELDADVRVYIKSEKCNGCGACVNECPQADRVTKHKNTGRAVALKVLDHGITG